VTQSRDFRKGATRRSPHRQGAPGWLWALIGLALGLAAAGVYTHLKNRPHPEATSSKPNRRAPISESDLPESDNGLAGPYTYDKTLKNNRVEIPEKNGDPKQTPRPLPELRPGTYVLQIGAFRSESEAESQRARLGMIGVESKIQPFTNNDQTFYRVRVGPFTSLDELNRNRSILRKADIESTQMRVSD
jgi:cell division protein FtsN